MAEEWSGYETFEHTADVGLRVRARDLEELLELAAQGMAHQMLDQTGVCAKEEYAVSAEADDPEELLVDWLSELLYAFEAEHFAPARAEVRCLESGRAEGVLVGESYDPDRHEVVLNIKAVTYHDLSVERTEQGLEVRVVFDI
jgi:SHS2 domain-containing protein